MNCACCTAPLVGRGVLCSYCGSRQDVDLRGWAHLRGDSREVELSCPDGHGPLEEVMVGAPEAVAVARCPTCLGLFLDRGTLEGLLDRGVGTTWEIDRPLLEALVANPRHGQGDLRYRPCPACGEMMNRRLFGSRSGVIVDRCRDHGTWLDPGELRQLLEWTRAGGHRLDRQRREEEQRERQRRKRQDRIDVAGDATELQLARAYPISREDELLPLLARGLRRLLGG